MPYQEFLQSYVIPQDCVINISLCGDLSVNFVDEGEELYTNVELDWSSPYGDMVEESLESTKEGDLYISDEFSTLEAGCLKLAEIYGYIVFWDLVSGEVVYLYHEELWEMSVVLGVDASKLEEIREYIRSRKLCHDFYDFLRLVCTGEIYDADEMRFKTIGELGQEEKQEAQVEDINVVKAKVTERIMASKGMPGGRQSKIMRICFRYL